jgi:nucleosome binding factor SPN SPT16 subunit
MTSTAMTHYFKAKLESVIDRGTKMSNQELADLVDEKVGNEEKEPDMKLWKKNPQLGEVSHDALVMRFGIGERPVQADHQIDWSSVEWGVNPIVQSGGKYDVRLSAVSADGNVSRGVVTCTMGVRYKTYSSLMSRTFMIDPTPVRIMPLCHQCSMGETELMQAATRKVLLCPT